MTLEEGKSGIIEFLNNAGCDFEVAMDTDEDFIANACIKFEEDQEPISVRYMVKENQLTSVAYYDGPITDNNRMDLLKRVAFFNSRRTSTSYLQMDFDEKRIRSVYYIRRDGEGWLPAEGRERFFLNPARMIDVFQSEMT